RDQVLDRPVRAAWHLCGQAGLNRGGAQRRRPVLDERQHPGERGVSHAVTPTSNGRQSLSVRQQSRSVLGPAPAGAHPGCARLSHGPRRGACGTGAGRPVTWQLGSEWPARAGKTIKGMFVALALVLTLSREPDPLSTLLALAGAVLAFTLGEVYDAAIEEQIRNRRGLRAAEFRAIAVDQSFI